MIVNGTLASGGNGHLHREVWGGEKSTHSDGYVYSRCDVCGIYWRSKSLTEYQDEATGKWLSTDPQANTKPVASQPPKPTSPLQKGKDYE